MNRSILLALPLLLAVGSQAAHAQSVSPAWDAYRQGQQAGEAQPQDPQAQVQTPAQPAPVVAPPLGEGDYYRPTRTVERDRGGFFVGAHAGKGWVYEDVDQDALMFNAGYRWQAGAVSLIGIELAAGRLSSTSDAYWEYEEVDFQSIGFNGRFNFGAGNPLYGIVRAGYWAADVSLDGYSEDVDGGYAGIGLGVDLGRHASLNLMYTNYVYATEYYWNEYELNRADVVTFGVEARF